MPDARLTSVNGKERETGLGRKSFRPLGSAKKVLARQKGKSGIKITLEGFLL